MTPTEEMVRAAARAFAPELWADHDNMTPTERAVWEAGLTAKKFIAEEKAKVALSAALAAMWQEPFAYAWEEVIDPTGEVINGKTVTRFATHWSTPPANAEVMTLYVGPAPTLLSTRMGSEKTPEG